MSRWARVVTVTTLVAAAAMCLGGCYTPQGGMMPYTGGPHTYYSTEFRPTTVTLVDLRTGEAIFSIEIPAGRQLTIDFDEGEGNDPVHTPDLLRYEVFPIGTTYGRLGNSVNVPNADSRRVDVTIRPGPEMPPAATGFSAP